MLLRYRIAVVTSAGSGLGRTLAVALGRAGASVLVVDPDLAAAEETAALVSVSRVRAWALQADAGDEDDLRLLAARARDLGGAELLVTSTEHGAATSAALVDQADQDDQAPRTVVVGPGAARGPVMHVVPEDTTPSARIARAVLDLLADGEPGQVVTLGP